MSTQYKTSKSERIAEKIMIFGGRVGNQRHFAAIRDAFGTFIPLIIIGSIATMMNALFINADSLLAQLVGAEKGNALYNDWANVAQYITPIFGNLWTATLGFFAIYMAALFGYFLTQSYGNNPIHGALLGMALFLVMDPIGAGEAYQYTNIDNEVVSGSWNYYFGSTGIIYGMIAGLAGPTLFYHVGKNGRFTIKMPDGVPPAVGASFAVLAPTAIVLFTFSLIQPIWFVIAHFSGLIESNPSYSHVLNIFSTTIVQPLMPIAENPFTISFIIFLIGLFWLVGIHGTNVLSPLTEGLWGVLTLQNVEAFSAVSDFSKIPEMVANGELHLWTKATMDVFIMFGGAGATLAMITGAVILSKNPATKEISKISFAPAAFNINEPVMFGTPLVMNFTYAIPFMFVNVIQTWIVWSATALGLVNPVVILVPWTTPAVISGLLATGDLWSIPLSLISFFLAFFAYIPFIFLDNKVAKRMEAEADAMLAEMMKEQNVEPEEEVDYSVMTKPELKAELDAKGIEYASSDSKTVLIEKLENIPVNDELTPQQKKEAKAAEKQAAKDAKEAEKLAAKAAKEAEKQAAKEAKKNK